MKNVINILALLGLSQDDLEVDEDCIETENAFKIYAHYKNRGNKHCPACGSVKAYSKGLVTQRINNTTKRYQGKKIVIELDKHKYHCLDCGKFFRDQISIVEKSSNISIYTKRDIERELLKTKTYKEIAYEHGVSVPTVLTIMDNLEFIVDKALRVSICIDEFHFKVDGESSYPAVISDGKTGRILDITRSRKNAYLIDYFRRKNKVELNTPKVICSDMNDGFRTVIRKIFPKALHIVDFFHVTKLFTALVNKKRIAYMKKLPEKSIIRSFLKKNWKAFLCNTEKIDEKYENGIRYAGRSWQASSLIFYIVKKDEILYESYKLYKFFCENFSDDKYREVKEIEKRLEYLIYKSNQNSDKDINTLGNTLLDWSSEIINAYSDKNVYKISNAIAEGNNNKIKTLIKISYGSSDFYRLRKRILYIENERKKTG